MEFTLDYFKEELVRFRKGMGDKTIMADPIRRDLLFKGFTLVYFNTKTTTPDDERFLRDMFTCQTNEFNTRESYYL